MVRSAPPRAAAPADRRIGRAFWIIATLAGLALRAELLPLAPRYGYVSDHDEFARWGIQAVDHGLTSLYSAAPPRWTAQIWDHDAKAWVMRQQQIQRVCNYPPLSACLLALSGYAFRAADANRLVNTTVSRACFSGWSILADVLLAAGIAAIVGRLRPGRASAWAYAVMLAAPPLWLDSVFWGQKDAVVLAPLAWMVFAILRRRWVTAGVLYGIALGLKPQAILFGPVWLFVLLNADLRRGAMIALGVAAATLFAIALPFTLTSRSSWLRLSYVENLTEAYSHVTTLFAFNVWYAQHLLGGSIDAEIRWLGLMKDTWSKLLLAFALAGGLIECRRRFGRAAAGVLVWSALCLLIVVMLPTRVHERYLVLALPFLVAVACWRPALWPGTALLLLAATLQLTWPNWCAQPPYPAERLTIQFSSQYDRQMASLPPEQRGLAESRDSFVEKCVRRYHADRRRTIPIEAAGTVAALLGSTLVVLGLRRAAPP